MYIICPHCSFGRDVPDNKVPHGKSAVRCPKCKNKFEFVNEEFGFEKSVASASNLPDASAKLSEEGTVTQVQKEHKPEATSDIKKNTEDNATEYNNNSAQADLQKPVAELAPKPAVKPAKSLKRSETAQEAWADILGKKSKGSGQYADSDTTSANSKQPGASKNPWRGETSNQPGLGSLHCKWEEVRWGEVPALFFATILAVLWHPRQFFATPVSIIRFSRIYLFAFFTHFLSNFFVIINFYFVYAYLQKIREIQPSIGYYLDMIKRDTPNLDKIFSQWDLGNFGYVALDSTMQSIFIVFFIFPIFCYLALRGLGVKHATYFKILRVMGYASSAFVLSFIAPVLSYFSLILPGLVAILFSSIVYMIIVFVGLREQFQIAVMPALASVLISFFLPCLVLYFAMARLLPVATGLGG